MATFMSLTLQLLHHHHLINKAAGVSSSARRFISSSNFSYDARVSCMRPTGQSLARSVASGSSFFGCLQGFLSRCGSMGGLQQKRLVGKEGARALFTGLVEEMGNVKDVQVLEDGGFEMTIEASLVFEDVKLGDSVAVNGTCSPVNLKRLLQLNTRMGGHFVEGHVDGTATIVSLEPENDSLWVPIKTTPEILKYIVTKGYIAVDGTSLTVVNVLDDESAFTFMHVAYTQQKVILSGKKVGGRVNLEVDISGKYVERMLQGYKATVAAV